MCSGHPSCTNRSKYWSFSLPLSLLGGCKSSLMLTACCSSQLRQNTQFPCDCLGCVWCLSVVFWTVGIPWLWSFPNVYLTTSWLNLVKHTRSLWKRINTLSRSLEIISGMRVLWSWSVWRQVGRRGTPQTSMAPQLFFCFTSLSTPRVGMELQQVTAYPVFRILWIVWRLPTVLELLYRTGSLCFLGPKPAAPPARHINSEVQD